MGHVRSLDGLFGLVLVLVKPLAVTWIRGSWRLRWMSCWTSLSILAEESRTLPQKPFLFYQHRIIATSHVQRILTNLHTEILPKFILPKCGMLRINDTWSHQAALKFPESLLVVARSQRIFFLVEPVRTNHLMSWKNSKFISLSYGGEFNF